VVRITPQEIAGEFSIDSSHDEYQWPDFLATFTTAASSSKKKEKLEALKRDLRKYNAAAPIGPRLSSYYHPASIQETLQRLRCKKSATSMADVGKSIWNKAQKNMKNLQSVEPAARPTFITRRTTELVIEVSRGVNGFHFTIPFSLREKWKDFKDDKNTFEYPLIAALMDQEAMGQLWPALNRLDRYEPGFASNQYFIFVAVAQSDWKEAIKIFKPSPHKPITYLIQLPIPSR